MDISSSYAKILGQKLFRTREFPRSGSKAKDGEKEKRKREIERERAKVGDNNGQATHGARKHAWRTQAAWAKRCSLHLFFVCWFILLPKKILKWIHQDITVGREFFNEIRNRFYES